MTTYHLWYAIWIYMVVLVRWYPVFGLVIDFPRCTVSVQGKVLRKCSTCFRMRSMVKTFGHENPSNEGFFKAKSCDFFGGKSHHECYIRTLHPVEVAFTKGWMFFSKQMFPISLRNEAWSKVYTLGFWMNRWFKGSVEIMLNQTEFVQ